MPLDLLDQLLSGDICGLIVPLALLLAVGQHCVRGRPRIERLSYLLGWCGLLLYLAASFLAGNVGSGADLFIVLLAGLLFAGYLIGATWLIAPLAALALDATVVQPLASLSRFFCRIAARVRGTREAWRRQRKARHQRRTWAAEAPLRARQQREREEQQRREAHAQRRREQERLETQLLYDRYREQLVESFPPEEFQRYFETFLTSDLPPELFRDRAQKLREMLQDRVQPVRRQRRETFQSFEEVVTHFERERERVEQLQLPDDVKETLLVLLLDAQEKAFEELLS